MTASPRTRSRRASTTSPSIAIGAENIGPAYANVNRRARRRGSAPAAGD
jgi:hypothetical protein